MTETPTHILELIKEAKIKKENSLFLYGRNLSSFPEEILELTNLKKLYLMNNQLAGLPESISKLVNLSEIYLNDNQLTSLPESIGQLTNLSEMYLNNNQLTNLPESIGQLPHLTELHLINNNLNNLPDISNSTNLIELSLRGNPIQSPPLEITKQGINAIKSYFEQQKKEPIQQKLYEAKVLIVGEGGAGKTSLCQKILDSNYKLQTESKNNSTEGIDISHYTFSFKDKQNFHLNLWDFGGQEIYHSTHQFFLTKRSLYLLVTDSRKDNTDLSYWLNIQQLLAEDAPVFIIQNEKQDRIKDLNSNEIRERFANLQGFYPTNLLDNRGLAAIVKAIELEVQKLPHIGTILPGAWAAIRKALEEKEVPYISLEAYFALCTEQGVDKKADAKVLSKYLHDIGVVLHFQDEPILKRLVILDNEWGTDAVYKVVDDEKVKRQQGKFEYSDLSNIWPEDCYRGKYPELLALMQKFKLCYHVPDTQNYIAPIRLPANKPKYVWVETGNIQLRYRYKFMPKGILTRFIVEMNQDIKKTEVEGAIANQLAWKTGVVLEREDTLAQVIEVYGEDEIRISIKGILANRLCSLITYQIDRINKTFHNLKVEKLIPCNCATCSGNVSPHFFKESNLLKRESVGKRTIECQAPPHYFNVKIRPLINNFALNDKQIDFNAIKEEGIRLISKGKLKEVFDLFESRNNQSRFSQDMNVHRAKWSHLENAKNQEGLEHEYYLREISKISKGLITLLSSDTDLEH